MKNKYLAIVTSVALLFLAGCASTNKNQYHWEEYEPLVYKTHISPDEVPPLLQIEMLEADIAKAYKNKKFVAPGVYAHLGLMYAAAGNKELAVTALNKEKELFPESATFIDGLLERSIKNKEVFK